MSTDSSKRGEEKLREDARAIWQAGVDAVRSDQLVVDHVQVAGDRLLIGDEEIDLTPIARILVVGAGKAGAGMAVGLETALGQHVLAAKQVTGWVNVPEGTIRPTQALHLHAARPAGVNEPTEEGVRGTQEILRIVESATTDDLVICLLSGGGSALLPAPIDGISLADKQQVTRLLSGAGANIEELNTVRKHLSRIKGGGLARACRAGRLISLIISDVLGDPLDVIASGPTVADSTSPRDAIEILDRFAPRMEPIPTDVVAALMLQMDAEDAQDHDHSDGTCPATNVVIGNNATAVDAAGIEAERRGYSHAMHAATSLEGDAETVGRHLAKMALRMREQPGPDCLITGGEPVVQLAAAAERGQGGRNQQLVLAALVDLLAQNPTCAGICLLSGGTDGEDGPTDAAGALFEEATAKLLKEQQLDPQDHLQRNDAYHFFAPLKALIKTGPTHTNVCDVRVVVVDRVESDYNR